MLRLWGTDNKLQNLHVVPYQKPCKWCPDVSALGSENKLQGFEDMYLNPRPDHGPGLAKCSQLTRVRCEDLVWTSIYDKYSSSMKMTSHLDHVSRCKAASGIDWSNRWTYRVFITNTRRDEIAIEWFRVAGCAGSILIPNPYTSYPEL